jgi:hypothetical protein
MIEENGGAILFTSKQQTKFGVYCSGYYYISSIGTRARWAKDSENVLKVAPDQLGYWDDTDTDT